MNDKLGSGYFSCIVQLGYFCLSSNRDMRVISGGSSSVIKTLDF